MIPMHRLRCAEIWGGIRNQDSDVCSAGISASLFSGACEGGKGGDIYYLSVCQSDMLTRIAVADVVGHGQAVSDVSSWLYDALSAHMNDTACNDILAELNGLACKRGIEALTTAIVVGYYTADSHLYFSYAGHHAMLVRNPADGEWTAAKIGVSDGKPANLPLGVDEEVMYEQDRLPLNSGDRLFLYTDGVIEARDSSGELFGERQLLSILREAGGKSLMDMKNTILDAVRDHTGGPLTHDDVTLLAVEVR